MSRAGRLLPLLALGLASWAVLWSLLALSGPVLPVASERGVVRASDMPLPRGGQPSAEIQLLRERLGGIAGAALRERLGPGYPFDLVSVEALQLTPTHAEVRMWGLLRPRRGPSAMLRVDLRISRGSGEIESLHAEAFGEREHDPFLTAWISNGPGVHQAAR